MSITSPCINVCQMDPRTGLCEGCYRSIDEITVWSSACDNIKRAILDNVEQRRVAAERLAAGAGARTRGVGRKDARTPN